MQSAQVQGTRRDAAMGITLLLSPCVRACGTAEVVAGEVRRAVLDDGMQHGADVRWREGFQRQIDDAGLDVLRDASASEVRVLSLAKDPALEVVVGQFRHRHDGSCRLDLRERFGLSHRLLAGPSWPSATFARGSLAACRVVDKGKSQ